MRFIGSLIFITFISFYGLAQEINHPLQAKSQYAQQKWVDSVYNAMSLNQRIGQLFMITNAERLNETEITDLIGKGQIGGIVYSEGSPIAQAKLNNQYQALSQVPLLIGLDAKWGLYMPLDSTYTFPYPLTLGAIADNALIEQMGRQVGEQAKRIGAHFNFAPDVAVKANAINPKLENYLFGEDYDQLVVKSLAFMKGLQDAGILASAKHFSGYTPVDAAMYNAFPTTGLEVIDANSNTLYPYKKLIEQGVSGITVGHLDPSDLKLSGNLPSSLSKNIVTGILKEQLQFEGLIFADALKLIGNSNYKTPGAVDLAAFLAGNDVLLISDNISGAITTMEDAYEAKIISEERLAYSVKKILMAKYKVGLNAYRPVAIPNLAQDLNRLQDELLNGQLMENAITVVRNQKEILPIRQLDSKRIAYVELGDPIDNRAYLEELRKYARVHQIKATRLDELLNKLQNYNTVIVGFHKSELPGQPYQFSDKELVWLYEMARTNTVILDVFASAYALKDLHSIENLEAIVVSYQNSEVAQRKSAQLLFGAIPAKGNLPVSAGPHFKAGDGYHFNGINSLSYGLPEAVGMSSEKLKKLDSMAKITIDRKAAPGLQILVARKGKVIYNKAFGKHTYEGTEKVGLDDMYDVASLTKILATLPLLMELEEQGVVTLDTKLSEILPEYKTSNKKNVTLKKMLSHYARLKPWVPFYSATLDASKKPDPKYYRRVSSPEFNVKVAEGLYLRSDYPDTIQKIIRDSDLLPRLQYRYSDFPYFILKEYIEKYYGKGLDVLVQDRFYQALGANHTTYNPAAIFSNSQLVPTEVDDYFRYQTLQGYVHDMGAAMQNGVGGHAGIFSNANDVAKIMQMYLQKGYYGGKRYLKPETIEKFNFCYYCANGVRRGVGFDKPQKGKNGPTCGCVSMSSFGHSGFTGTYAWADPEEEIVYVFLSNRNYPNENKNILNKEGIRTEIQRLIYEAIIE